MVQGTNFPVQGAQDHTAEARRIETRFVEKSFCFVAGTHVTTIRGDIPVEDLKSGDLIRARNGNYVPVRTVAVFEVSSEQMAERPDLHTTTLRRGALGEGLPKRDLHVTGGQRFETAFHTKIEHLGRMSVRSGQHIGDENRKTRFIAFGCLGAPAVRVERLWVTATPCIGNFNLPRGKARALLAEAVASGYSAA